MASDREIERVRKDTDRWRSLASQLLRFVSHAAFTDWELDFLEGILSEARALEELSYRQAEILLEIRDDVEVISSHAGRSVRYLIKLCYESRRDFEEDDEAWVVDIHQSGRTSVRRREAWRLLRLAKQTGEVEDDWAA